MSEQSLFISLVQGLRDETQRQHGSQTERYETLRTDFSAGIDKMRDEVRDYALASATRLGALEARVTRVEEQAKPVARAVYWFVALVGGGAMMFLIKGGHF